MLQGHLVSQGSQSSHGIAHQEVPPNCHGGNQCHPIIVQAPSLPYCTPTLSLPHRICQCAQRLLMRLETPNAQESVVAPIKNPATTSSRGSLRECPFSKSRCRQPHHEVGIAHTKRFFFLLPCSSNSCCAYKFGRCHNQKISNNKFKRRPQRAPPPNSNVASLSTRQESHAQKDSFFKKILATSCSMTLNFVSNNLLGRSSQPIGKWQPTALVNAIVATTKQYRERSSERQSPEICNKKNL